MLPFSGSSPPKEEKNEILYSLLTQIREQSKNEQAVWQSGGILRMMVKEAWCQMGQMDYLIGMNSGKLCSGAIRWLVRISNKFTKN